MEDLLKPDYGVLLLTVCNFLLLVYLLKKFAWGPVIGALEKRENQITADKQTAAQERQQAAQLKAELDDRLAQISSEAARQVAAAVKTGEKQQAQLLEQARVQAAQLLEQAKVQIQTEKDQALAQVRREIATISMMAASRIVGRHVQDSTADEIVAQVLQEVQKK